MLHPKNLDLERLKQIMEIESSSKSKAEVYAYVLSSVSIEDGCFVQYGCAPNFQGDHITLCTCKHQMRARRSKEKWPGAWVAGFTSRRYSGQHYLFYLTRIGLAFESHLELWYKAGFSERTKRAKCASNNEFGDLFRPLRQNIKPFQFQSYNEPVKNHCHHKTSADTGWHNDICYKSRAGNRPALLVGQAALSFLWTKPSVSTENLTRDYRHYFDLTLFLSSLKDARAQ
jgi:hypothetical protein